MFKCGGKGVKFVIDCRYLEMLLKVIAWANLSH